MFQISARPSSLRFRLLIAAVFISVLVLGACNVVQPALEAPPQATPTQPAAAPVSTSEARTPASPAASQPTPTPEPTQPAIPTPFADGSDNQPGASQTAMRQETQGLSTPEVVKILTPSVVQVATEVVTLGFINQPVPSQGVGTGVILDTTGHIMTNNHVVEGAQRITVTLASGETLPAEVVGADFQTDLAVIRIDPGNTELQPARLGSASELLVGQDVIAIGHALGLPGGPTVSKGVISALNRSIDIDPQNTSIDLIQTDAEINPGNSGGPLVSSSAEVIGINTAIIQSGRGIGFAINVDDARVVVEQLIESGFVERGFIGISPMNVSPSLAARFNLPLEEGILVTRVIPGSAAARAGLRPEDIIIQLGDTPIFNTGEMSRFLMDHQPGEIVKIVYYRGDMRIEDRVTLGGRPPS